MSANVLDRLLRIRALEEEQRRASLETALEDLDALKQARAAAGKRERQARARVGASAVSGDVLDRHAGVVEMAAARRRTILLAPRIAACEAEAERRREEFLEKRVERRQVGTLIEEAEAREERESGRRSQRAVDDWYAAQRHEQTEDGGRAPKPALSSRHNEANHEDGNAQNGDAFPKRNRKPES
jgi:flagellar export protein FliJ